MKLLVTMLIWDNTCIYFPAKLKVILWSNLYPLSFLGVSQNFMKEQKCCLPFSNICNTSGDIWVRKMSKIYKWEEWQRHTLNLILCNTGHWKFAGDTPTAIRVRELALIQYPPNCFQYVSDLQLELELTF